MRISVPGIPQAVLDAKPIFSVKSVKEATERLSEFLGFGNVTVLTGAGVSVDSGIRAYRGDDGRYMNPNYKPIFWHELVDSSEKGHAFRLRSYLGYPPVRDARPNTTHFALAALQHTSHISRIITQNVDGLHHKALRETAALHWNSARMQENILELHGTLHHVHCNRGHVVDRNTFQDRLSAANPKWYQYAEELERIGMQPRTNPDGDVAVEQLGISYNDFVVPNCPECLLEDHQNSVLKPEVVFFGESIPKVVKDRSYADRQIMWEQRTHMVFSDIETSKPVISYFSWVPLSLRTRPSGQWIPRCTPVTVFDIDAPRLLKHALELKKPVILLNVGPSRADGLPGIVKLDIPSGAIMRDVARNVIGSRETEDPIVAEMLQSGVINPTSADEDDGSPRAAG
ncbi:hypothetical protein CVT25_010297 [Psilocybe cyanescens]|uniref:Deacetylase sirtuin-type domain-containing protein n=1 Tax=Psilocybe cyanescens TaxID=93625 RepID=A0A409VNQ4_PSICY|nr:hypothetical protein CVT25_010297 [Psilocybe cyanescens]